MNNEFRVISINKNQSKTSKQVCRVKRKIKPKKPAEIYRFFFIYIILTLKCCSTKMKTQKKEKKRMIIWLSDINLLEYVSFTNIFRVPIFAFD